MSDKLYTLGLACILLFTGNTSVAQYTFEIIPFHEKYQHPIPASIKAIDTLLYMTASDGTHGKELWISDGTLTGSYMVKDIYPGKDAEIFPGHYIKYNNKVYFCAADATTGLELWVTDGTANGTQLVKDINPGVLSSNATDFIEVNGKLLFWADDGTHGKELWVTDGTTNGTQLLKDVTSGGSYTPLPQYGNDPFTVFNGKMYFATNKELWETDGTTIGTQPATVVSPGASFSNISPTIIFNNKLYFTATYKPATSGSTQDGLWESDGTVNGTKYITQIFWDGNVAIMNNKMFFSGRENSNTGDELYCSDGTANGTQLVKDIYATIYRSSDPEMLTVVDNKLFFTANDSVHGEELWVSDGTTAGTIMVKDIMFDPQKPTWGAEIKNLTAYNKKVFFTARDTHSRFDLWVSDGTTAGTKKLLAKGQDSFYSVDHMEEPFIVCNNSMYFIGNSIYYPGPWSNIYTLWKMTDTTITPPPNTVNNNSVLINSFNIMPNPAHDNVRIETPWNMENGRIILTDISGKVMMRHTVRERTNSTELQLPELPAGVYTISVETEGAIYNEKLLIK